MEVIILAAEDSYYGVIPVELNNTFKRMQEVLLKKKSKFPAVEKPEIDLIYADWSNVVARVRVLETNPLVLHYLDFGYEEIKDTYCNLRKIPDSLANIDPIAFKMTVKNDEMELREFQTVTVQILDKILEGHYFVEVLTETDSSESRSLYESASEQNTVINDSINSPARRISNDTFQNMQKVDTSPVVSASVAKNVANDDVCSVISSVATTVIGEEFMTRYPNLPKKYFINEISNHAIVSLTIMNCLNDSRYTGMLMQKMSPHRDFLRKYLIKITADPDYKPAVGDIIAALLPGTEIWSRAVVLSLPTDVTTKYRVAMIDVGCVYDVEDIASLNNNFHDLSNLSVYCDIQLFPDKKKSLKLYKTYKCEIIKKLPNGTTVGRVWNTAKLNQEYEVNFRPWNPSIDELGVSKMPISNNSRVKISAHNRSNECHVVLCDDDNAHIELCIMEDVACYCEEAEPMTNEPFISEIVGVKYEESFWRGKVLEKEGDSYCIFLLDRGIQCTSQLKQMIPLPEDLKLPFGIAVPVTLKNVPVTEIFPKVSKYMNKLITKEKKFDVIIDNENRVVELKFLHNESYGKENDQLKTLNEYLADIMIPCWKKSLKSPVRDFDDDLDMKFFISDVTYDELVVGSKMILYVANIDSNSASFIVINKNGKNYKKLLDVNLYGRLAEYANTVTDSYVPTQSELCIVRHEDVWYRALCLDSQPNSKIVVQLIDDGLLICVWHTHIRKMIAEFSHYVATALICNSKDEKEFDKEQAEKLINSLVPFNILEQKTPGEYIVDCSKLYQ